MNRCPTMTMKRLVVGVLVWLPDWAAQPAGRVVRRLWPGFPHA